MNTIDKSTDRDPMPADPKPDVPRTAKPVPGGTSAWDEVEEKELQAFPPGRKEDEGKTLTSSQSKEIGAEHPAPEVSPAPASEATTVSQGIREDRASVQPLAEQFAADLDARMAKSQLEELGWRGRSDLDAVLRDLERLAQVDWQRAAKMWDKYRPGDDDKPVFIDGDDKDPPAADPQAMPGSASGHAGNADLLDDSEQPGSEPEKSSAAKKPVIPNSLLKRYLVAENKFYFRDDPNLLAFEDSGKRLATEHNDPDVAKSMVELAAAKSWTSLRIKGTDEFRREVWLAASLRGMDVQGYQPSALDKARLEELRKERPPRQQNAIEQGYERELSQNSDSAKSTHQLQRAPAPTQDQATPLSKHHRIAIDTLRAILTERGDSERAIDMAMQVATERFQQQRAYIGRLVAHGAAPFGHNPSEQPNYFVTLKTINGDKTVWGIDLQRAVAAANVQKGDDLAILFHGRRPVTVKKDERDDAGKLTGKRIDATVSRNAWEVSKLDKMRDDANARLRGSPENGTRLAPQIAVYDCAAGKKQNQGNDKASPPHPERPLGRSR